MGRAERVRNQRWQYLVHAGHHPAPQDPVLGAPADATPIVDESVQQIDTWQVTPNLNERGKATGDKRLKERQASGARMLLMSHPF